ncbi:MAG: hypothetical protein Q9217_005114 [Psora testacea]
MLGAVCALPFRPRATNASQTFISGVTDLIGNAAKFLACASKVIEDAVKLPDPPIDEIESLTTALQSFCSTRKKRRWRQHAQPSRAGKARKHADCWNKCPDIHLNSKNTDRIVGVSEQSRCNRGYVDWRKWSLSRGASDHARVSEATPGATEDPKLAKRLEKSVRGKVLIEYVNNQVCDPPTPSQKAIWQLFFEDQHWEHEQTRNKVLAPAQRLQVIRNAPKHRAAADRQEALRSLAAV